MTERGVDLDVDLGGEGDGDYYFTSGGTKKPLKPKPKVDATGRRRVSFDDGTIQAHRR